MTNARTAANRFLVPAASASTFAVILALDPRFNALAETRHDRKDGHSYASAVLSTADRIALLAAVDAAAAVLPPLRTAARRIRAAFESTSTRYAGLATVHSGRDATVYHLGLRARTFVPNAPTCPIGDADADSDAA